MAGAERHERVRGCRAIRRVPLPNRATYGSRTAPTALVDWVRGGASGTGSGELAEIALGELDQAVVAILAGTGEDLFDVRAQAAFAPVVAGGFFGVAGVARAGAFEECFGRRGIVAWIVTRRETDGRAGFWFSAGVFVDECSRHIGKLAGSNRSHPW